MRIFLTHKGVIQKKEDYFIFLNNIVGLANEIASFLHDLLSTT